MQCFGIMTRTALPYGAVASCDGDAIGAVDVGAGECAERGGVVGVGDDGEADRGEVRGDDVDGIDGGAGYDCLGRRWGDEKEEGDCNRCHE